MDVNKQKNDTIFGNKWLGTLNNRETERARASKNVMWFDMFLAASTNFGIGRN